MINLYEYLVENLDGVIIFPKKVYIYYPNNKKILIKDINLLKIMYMPINNFKMHWNIKNNSIIVFISRY